MDVAAQLGIFEPAPDEKIFANEATSAREKLADAEVAAMENNAAPGCNIKPEKL
jgi:hypothetical protein